MGSVTDLASQPQSQVPKVVVEDKPKVTVESLKGNTDKLLLERAVPVLSYSINDVKTKKTQQARMSVVAV